MLSLSSVTCHLINSRAIYVGFHSHFKLLKQRWRAYVLRYQTSRISFLVFESWHLLYQAPKIFSKLGRLKIVPQNCTCNRVSLLNSPCKLSINERLSHTFDGFLILPSIFDYLSIRLIGIFWSSWHYKYFDYCSL